MLGLALLSVVILRIGFLAVVHAAMIPLVSVRYLAPAYPLALAFVTLALCLAARAAATRWRQDDAGAARVRPGPAPGKFGGEAMGSGD